MHATLKYFGALSICGALAASIAFVADSVAQTGHDKYTSKVPGGLAFAEFKGYEGWQAVSISRNDKAMALILGNPVLIEAYRNVAAIPVETERNQLLTRGAIDGHPVRVLIDTGSSMSFIPDQRACRVQRVFVGHGGL
jgi:hypothetical protein